MSKNGYTHNGGGDVAAGKLLWTAIDFGWSNIITIITKVHCEVMQATFRSKTMFIIC